jgi:hypothetical protein
MKHKGYQFCSNVRNITDMIDKRRRKNGEDKPSAVSEEKEKKKKSKKNWER